MAGPVRSLLLRLEVRDAGRRSSCARDRGHVIHKGNVRFVVRDRGPAAGEKGYCAVCALEMLGKAQNDLSLLVKELRESA